MMVVARVPGVMGLRPVSVLVVIFRDGSRTAMQARAPGPSEPSVAVRCAAVERLSGSSGLCG